MRNFSKEPGSNRAVSREVVDDPDKSRKSLRAVSSERVNIAPPPKIIFGTSTIFGHMSDVNLQKPWNPKFCDPILFVTSAITMLMAFMAIFIGLVFYLFTFFFSYYEA